MHSSVLLHPSALVDRGAQLGAGVEVGPYAVIEGPARIGDRCQIQAHAIIGASVTMGTDNVIGYGAIIGAEPQDFAFRQNVRSQVQIGDGNKIREYCTIHRGTVEGSATVVGDGCFLMAGTHLGHNVRLGHKVVIANNSLLGGYVAIEDAAFIGGGSVFHQFVRIGRLSICQGLAGLSKDVPPFAIAAGRNQVIGLNVIGLRRAGFTAEERGEIKRAFDLVYRSGLNTTQMLEAATKQPWGAASDELFRFVAGAKKRGICPIRRGRTGDDLSTII